MRTEADRECEADARSFMEARIRDARETLAKAQVDRTFCHYLNIYLNTALPTPDQIDRVSQRLIELGLADNLSAVLEEVHAEHDREWTIPF